MTDDEIDMVGLYVLGIQNRGTPLISLSTFLAFNAYLSKKQVLVSCIEAYEMRGEFQIPRTDFNIVEPDADFLALSWSERVRYSEKEVQALVAKMREEDCPFGVQVWIDVGEE